MRAGAGNGGGAAPGSGAARVATDGGTVRMILFDADSASQSRIQETLENIGGVRVVDVVTDGEGLVASIERASPPLVVANLDPAPDGIMSSVASISGGHPDITFLAVSTRDDAGLIKSAVRSGFSDIIKLPEEVERLAEEIGKIRLGVEGHGGAGRIISVLGSAGGVGCTTVAVNLAVELADKSGKEVALVDLNFQFGHVAMMLDLEIQHSIANLCSEGKTIDERVVQKAVTKHKSGVHVVPRPRNFEETEGLTAESCVPLITLLRQMYPFVVLDGPSCSDPTALSVLEITDWNLLVVQPLVTSARNAKRILSALEKYGFKGQALKAVCNRAGGGLSHLNSQRLEKSLGTDILLCVPDDWTSVSAAINLGEPLSMNAPKSKARDAMRELADIVRGAGAETADKSAGFFGRLLKK
ncbi:MAG: AAA family ATPase [Phycisphaerae bacterium]